MVSPPEDQPPKHRFAHRPRHLLRQQPVDPLMQIPKGLGRSRTVQPPLPYELEAEVRDPAEILRRARESEAVQYERDRKNRSAQNQRFSSRVHFNHLGTSSPFQNNPSQNVKSLHQGCLIVLPN